MARRNKKGRPVTGIVLVDKPSGHSSNHVLQQVKRLFNARKAGHTGSLDPLASGVLPVCLGEATKLSGYLLDADKQYLVTCQLGVTTDSGDSDGQVLEQTPIPEFDQQALQSIIDTFIGEQDQVPPMFSALKHQGQPLYKLARQGIEIERKSRRICIYAIDLIDYTDTTFTLSVRCSKGTYIRTLVEDISHRLGCGGHVIMLRRTAVAGFALDDAITLDELQQRSEQQILDQSLIAAEEALPDWPAIEVDEAGVTALGYGRQIKTSMPFQCANVRLFDPNGTFLGLGDMRPDGVIQPKRMFVLSDS